MYLGEEGNPIRLLHNQYFEDLAQRGYRLNVWWGHHIDYCSHSPVVIDNCIQVPANGLEISQRLLLNTSERVELVFSRYLNLSGVYQGVRNSYRIYRNQLLPYGLSLPSSTWDRHKVTTLPYLFSLDALGQTILNLPEGNALFAHLLLPHNPFVVNSDCTMKTSIHEWKYGNLLDTPHYPYREGVINTDDSRITHYQAYLKQVQCIYVKLDELFKKMKTEGIYENSVIVIHGDHGSRIVQTGPTIEHEHELSRQDIIAGYSTIFAVKIPNQGGYYDPKPYPLEYLLQAKVVNALFNIKRPVPLPAPSVFLGSSESPLQEFKPIPYPTSF